MIPGPANLQPEPETQPTLPDTTTFLSIASRAAKTFNSKVNAEAFDAWMAAQRRVADARNAFVDQVCSLIWGNDPVDPDNSHALWAHARVITFGAGWRYHLCRVTIGGIVFSQLHHVENGDDRLRATSVVVEFEGVIATEIRSHEELGRLLMPSAWSALRGGDGQ